MRKLCALLIGATLMFGAAFMPATVAAQPSGKLELVLGQKSGNSNGVIFDLPEAPVVEGKHSLVPVRSIASKLGGQVTFDKKSKQVMLTFGKQDIVMQVGKTECYVNGKRYSLPIAPQQKGNNGTVFVPIRWLCETLGARVDFLPNGKIKINCSWHHDEPSKPLLPVSIPYEVAVGADVSWAELGEAGVVTKLVTVKGQDKLLVVIKRGPVPSTGYGIELQSLAMNSWGSISAHVEYTNPALDSYQAQVIRYPYQAVYVDPLYVGHEFKIALVNKTWDQLAAVPKTLKSTIDRSKRGVLVGYGRDLLHDPGVWADKLLLVAMRGYCPTGGYSITIDSLLRHDDDLVLVKVSEQDPAPFSMVTMAITYPYHIVEIPVELAQYKFQLLEK